MPNVAFLKAEGRAESAELLLVRHFSFNFPPSLCLHCSHPWPCGAPAGRVVAVAEGMCLSRGWVTIGQGSAQKPFAPFGSLPTAGWDRHGCCWLGRHVPQALGKRGEKYLKKS